MVIYLCDSLIVVINLLNSNLCYLISSVSVNLIDEPDFILGSPCLRRDFSDLVYDNKLASGSVVPLRRTKLDYRLQLSLVFVRVTKLPFTVVNGLLGVRLVDNYYHAYTSSNC